MRYQFCTDITDPVLDGLVLIADFECEVEIDLDWRDGEPVATCTDVLVNGESLRGGSALTKAIRIEVMQQADDDLENAGPLWDAVAAREDISFCGAAGDPDAHWSQAAE